MPATQHYPPALSITHLPWSMLGLDIVAAANYASVTHCRRLARCCKANCCRDCSAECQILRAVCLRRLCLLRAAWRNPAALSVVASLVVSLQVCRESIF